jgi:hypothetical protein
MQTAGTSIAPQIPLPYFARPGTPARTVSADHTFRPNNPQIQGNRDCRHFTLYRSAMSKPSLAAFHSLWRAWSHARQPITQYGLQARTRARPMTAAV